MHPVGHLVHLTRRQFCSDTNVCILPAGTGTVESSDWVASMFATFLTLVECFQRGSIKDEVIVYMFIVSVCFLLGVMLLKPWIGDYAAKFVSYNPVSRRDAR